MELVAFSLEGYRRFRDKTSVKLVGRLIAFVGPNEAGKSSVLEAMASLHDDEPFKQRDRPRRSELLPKLSWHFKLTDEDKALLVDIHGTESIQRVVVTRQWERKTSWHFEPDIPCRDISHRKVMSQRLEKMRDILAEIGVGIEASSIDPVLEIGGEDCPTLGTHHLNELDELVAELHEAKRVETEAESDDQDQEDDHFIEEIRTMTDCLIEVIELERATSSADLVVQALQEHLPRFRLFAQEDRDLKSEYDLAEVAEDPPAALAHLASLADLNLKGLLLAMTEGRTADVSTSKKQANEQLSIVFSENWNQKDVALQIDTDGTILLIQATTPDDNGLSSVSERSDGMRWFASLLAYSHGWRNPTILLADEIETHLHYEAQADLIDVLLKQTFSRKVIYTTHSFGCLPPDLGAGVRVVRQIDAGSSRLENGFWNSGSGFSPLLIGMGAAATSFTPAHKAVVTEGPADTVLLPTLLREANDQEWLEYRIVPGLSPVAACSVDELQREAGSVMFLTDSDDGGAELRSMLKRNGVEHDRIFEYTPGKMCELEDLVKLDLYVDAVNAELECWEAPRIRLLVKDFGTDRLRTKVLERWCKEHSIAPPSKVTVAQRLVEMAADTQIVAKDAKATLKRLHKKLSRVN